MTDAAAHPGPLTGGTQMDLIVTLIVGGLIGWLASLIMKTDAQMGILANILVGIVGSFLGHWLAGAMGLAVTGPARWLVTGLMGPINLRLRLYPRSVPDLPASGGEEEDHSLRTTEHPVWSCAAGERTRERIHRHRL